MKKKVLTFIVGTFAAISTLTAQMKAPEDWIDYEEVMGVKN